MSISRIYQATPFHLQERLRLEEKASHHLARVLRAQVGDALTLFNGQGGEYRAVISHIDKKGVEVEIREFVAREVASPLQLHLAQGIAKGEKMDFIIQKATELGVSAITPIITERCNVRLQGEREEKRMQHWISVAISACEQSGRNDVPTIFQPISFMEWLPTIQAELAFVLSPHVSTKLDQHTLTSGNRIVLTIGPEGGLSPKEMDAASEHGFKPLNLGPRVLRTETAALAALSVLQYQFGDL